MDKLTSPYVDTEQFAKISLQPYQMTNDININLKINLKKKVEKKCNQNGYISKIYKIVEKSHGIIDAENFNASATFQIKYNCKLCLPIENTIIIGKIRTINRVLMVIENGPILSIVLSNNINFENFKLNNQNNFENRKSKKELKVGDFVKIKILSKTFNYNDNQIKTMAFLEDIASSQEINKYYDTINQDNELVLSDNNQKDLNYEESDDSFQNYDSEEDFNDDENSQKGGQMSNFII